MLGALVLFPLVSSLLPAFSYSSACTQMQMHNLAFSFSQLFFMQCCVRFLLYVAVPPAYYAHLAAFRARFYMEPETSDSGSMTSGTIGRGGMGGGVGARSTRGPGVGAAVRPLPALKENVKRVMFYC